MSVNEHLAQNPNAEAAQRQAERDFVWPYVAVGEPGIVWYPHASREAGPVPCVVQEENKGILTVTVFPKNGMPMTKTGVRHMDDPFHKTHRQPHVVQQGGWDYYSPALKDTKVAQHRTDKLKAAKIKEAEEKAAREARKKIEDEDAATKQDDSKKLVGAGK